MRTTSRECPSWTKAVTVADECLAAPVGHSALPANRRGGQIGPDWRFEPQPINRSRWRYQPGTSSLVSPRTNGRVAR